MSWEIVAGLITLVGAVIGIGKVIANNTSALTEVRCGIEELKAVLSDQKEDLKDVSAQVEDHETRITVLEKTQHN